MGSFYEGDPDDDDDLSGGIVGTGVAPPSSVPEPKEDRSKPKFSSGGAGSSRYVYLFLMFYYSNIDLL